MAGMALMAQPVTSLNEMTLADYFSLFQGWQEAHKDADELEAPDPDWWQEQQERIMETPELTGVS